MQKRCDSINSYVFCCFRVTSPQSRYDLGLYTKVTNNLNMINHMIISGETNPHFNWALAHVVWLWYRHICGHVNSASYLAVLGSNCQIKIHHLVHEWPCAFPTEKCRISCYLVCPTRSSKSPFLSSPFPLPVIKLKWNSYLLFTHKKHMLSHAHITKFNC